MIKVLENVYVILIIIHRTIIFHLIIILYMKDTDTMQLHCNTFIQLVQEFSTASGNTTSEIYASMLFFLFLQSEKIL
jgi:hypothetical protein